MIKKGLLALFLMVFMSFSVAAQFPEINAHYDAIRDRATITWTTDIPTASSLEINNKVLVYGPDTHFSHEELGLSSGITYKYSIVSCSDSDCSTYKSSFNTPSEEALVAITGNAVADTGQGGPEVYYFLVALLGLTLLFVAYRASQPDAKIEKLINKSEHHIRNGDHERATPSYKEALGIYMNLGAGDKTQHYQRLMRVYNHLSLNQKQKEAQELTAKYASGTITAQEMSRLRQLLSE